MGQYIKHSQHLRFYQITDCDRFELANAAIDLCWITLKVEKKCPESQILCQIEKSVSDYGVFLIQYCWYVDTLVEDSGVRLEMFDCIDMYVV